MKYSIIFDQNGDASEYRNDERDYTLVENEWEVTEVQYNQKCLKLNEQNEMVEDATLIAAYKDKKIAELKALSYTQRRLLFDDKREANALGGVYDASGASNIPTNLNKVNAIKTIEACRDEVFRVEALINDEAITTADQVDTEYDKNSFPTEIITE